MRFPDPAPSRTGLGSSVAEIRPRTAADADNAPLSCCTAREATRTPLRGPPGTAPASVSPSARWATVEPMTACPPSVSSRGPGRPYASHGQGPGGSPSLTPAGPRCWLGAGGSAGCRAPGAGCATMAMGTWETSTPGDSSPLQQHPRRGLAPRVAFRHAPRHTAKSSPFTRWRGH